MKTSAARKLVGKAALLFTLGFAYQQSDATVILTGCGGADFGAACSLAELTAGGTININGTVFSNFQLSTFAGRAINQSVIRIDPIDQLLNPGVTLVDTANTLLATNGDATQSDFGFKVTGGLPIKDNSLAVAIGGVAGAGSFINVFEFVFDSSVSTLLSSTDVICDTPACANTTGTDAATFAPTVPGVVIPFPGAMGIDVISAAGGTAEINSISLQFSQVQVPEPATLTLLGLGLAGLGWSRRKK
ncbi:MAG TPA: PEP-CTERM sorting domain-containing protein [Burkholderiales bacterium]|nr:PEP-CTERM sorting domain-containing protein [Burkholderiales bacterium]